MAENSELMRPKTCAQYRLHPIPCYATGLKVNLKNLICLTFKTCSVA